MAAAKKFVKVMNADWRFTEYGPRGKVITIWRLNLADGQIIEHYEHRGRDRYTAPKKVKVVPQIHWDPYVEFQKAMKERRASAEVRKQLFACWRVYMHGSQEDRDFVRNVMLDMAEENNLNRDSVDSLLCIALHDWTDDYPCPDLLGA